MNLLSRFFCSQGRENETSFSRDRKGKHLVGLSQEGHGLLEDNLRVHLLKDKDKSQILVKTQGRLGRVKKIEIRGDAESIDLAAQIQTLFLTRAFVHGTLCPGHSKKLDVALPLYLKNMNNLLYGISQDVFCGLLFPLDFK